MGGDVPVHGDGDPIHPLDIGAEAANQLLEFGGGGIAHRVGHVESRRAL